MTMLAISVALGAQRRVAGGGAPPPAVPIPDNNRLAFLGDSRTSAYLGTGGITGTSRQLLLSGGFQPNIMAIDPRWQLAEDDTNADGSVPLGMYGIAGQHLTNYDDDPRATAALSLKHLATDPACVVTIYGDVNYFKPGGSDAASQITLLEGIIDYLTNPANCGGLQKVVVIIDETPIGIDLTGANLNGMANTTAAAAMRTYAGLVRALDYRQPGGNPYVVVIPAYEDFLDPASGSNLYNYQGLSNDGTHTSTIAAMWLAQKWVDEMDALADAMALSNAVEPHLPTAATVGNFLNANPMLTGTGGGISDGAATVTFTSGAVPTSWTWATQSGSATVNVVQTFETDADGHNVLVLAMTWTGASAGGYVVLFREQISAAALATAGFAVGDVAQLAAKAVVDAGSVNFTGVGISCRATSTTNANNFTGNSVPALNKGVLAGYPQAFDQGGKTLWLETPLVPTATIDDAGASFATTNAFLMGFTFYFGEGSGSATVRLSRCGLRKVV